MTALTLSLRTEKDTDYNKIQLLSCFLNDKSDNRQLGVNRMWLDFECHFRFHVNREIEFYGQFFYVTVNVRLWQRAMLMLYNIAFFIIKRLRYQLHERASNCVCTFICRRHDEKIPRFSLFISHHRLYLDISWRSYVYRIPCIKKYMRIQII